jgi:hypothetical protein
MTEAIERGWYLAWYKAKPDCRFCVERRDHYSVMVTRDRETLPDNPDDLVLGPKIEDIYRDHLRMEWLCRHQEWPILYAATGEEFRRLIDSEMDEEGAAK